ncbi:unknown [Clostridium sp. CAG:413]|nr:unknown [Clostridium sp. CAG:413]
MKKRLNQKIIAIALSLLAIILIAVPAFAAKAPQMENNYRCPACGSVFTNAKKWEKHREKCFYEADGPAYYTYGDDKMTTEDPDAEETTTETTTERTTVTETTVPEITVTETAASTEAPSQTTTTEATTHIDATTEATTRIVATTVKKTEAATVNRTPVMFVPEVTEATVIKTLDDESAKVTVAVKVSESVADDFETESNVDDEFFYSEYPEAVSDDTIPSTGSSKGVVVALTLVIIASAAIIAVKRKDDNISA